MAKTIWTGKGGDRLASNKRNWSLGIPHGELVGYIPSNAKIEWDLGDLSVVLEFEDNTCSIHLSDCLKCNGSYFCADVVKTYASIATADRPPPQVDENAVVEWNRAYKPEKEVLSHFNITLEQYSEIMGRYDTAYTWSNGGGTGVASLNTNWSPNGVPGAGAGDTVLFDGGTSTANCNWNILPANILTSFTMNANYSPGIVNVTADQTGAYLTYEGAVTIHGGTLTNNLGANKSATEGNNFTMDGGTVDSTNSGVNYNATGVVNITAGTWTNGTLEANNTNFTAKITIYRVWWNMTPSGTATLQWDLTVGAGGVLICPYSAGIGTLNTNGKAVNTSAGTFQIGTSNTVYTNLICGASAFTCSVVTILGTPSYLTMSTSTWSVGSGGWTSASTSASWNVGTSVVTFTSSCSLSVVTMSTNGDFYSVVSNDNVTVTIGSNVTIQYSLSVNGTTAGGWTGAYNLQVGTLSNPTALQSFSTGSNAVFTGLTWLSLSGTGNYQFDGSAHFGNLAVNSSSTLGADRSGTLTTRDISATLIDVHHSNTSQITTLILNGFNINTTTTLRLNYTSGAYHGALTCGASNIGITTFQCSQTTGYVTFNTSSWTVGGDFTVASTSASWNRGTATITFSNTSTQSLALNNGASSSITYYNITIAGAHTTKAVTWGANTITITGLLNCTATFTSGVITCATNNPNFSIGGGMSLASGSTWTKGSGTMTFNGTGSITDSNATLQDLGVVTTSGSITLTLGFNAKMTTFVLANNGILALGTYTIQLTGNTFTLNATSTVTVSSGGVTFLASATITDSNGTLQSIGAVSNSGTVTLTLGSNVKFGTASLTAVTLAISTHTLNIGGNLTFLGTANSLTYSGSGGIQFYGNSTVVDGTTSKLDLGTVNVDSGVTVIYDYILGIKTTPTWTGTWNKTSTGTTKAYWNGLNLIGTLNTSGYGKIHEYRWDGTGWVPIV